MSLVEKKYYEALSQLTGQQRLARTFSLYDSLYSMIKLQIDSEFSFLTSEARKIKIAERLYSSDPKTLKLISKKPNE
jgi:hypothetical protein